MSVGGVGDARPPLGSLLCHPAVCASELGHAGAGWCAFRFQWGWMGWGCSPWGRLRSAVNTSEAEMSPLACVLVPSGWIRGPRADVWALRSQGASLVFLGGRGFSGRLLLPVSAGAGEWEALCWSLLKKQSSCPVPISHPRRPLPAAPPFLGQDVTMLWTLAGVKHVKWELVFLVCC